MVTELSPNWWHANRGLALLARGSAVKFAYHHSKLPSLDLRDAVAGVFLHPTLE